MLHSPLGVFSFAQYFEVMNDLYRTNPLLADFGSYLLEKPPHNALLSAGSLLGVPFLFFVLYFLWQLLKIRNRYIWGFLFGVGVSMFHNLSFLYADYFSWVILAFGLHLVKNKGLDSAGAKHVGVT